MQITVRFCHRFSHPDEVLPLGELYIIMYSATHIHDNRFRSGNSSPVCSSKSKLVLTDQISRCNSPKEKQLENNYSTDINLQGPGTYIYLHKCRGKLYFDSDWKYTYLGCGQKVNYVTINDRSHERRSLVPERNLSSSGKCF